MSSVTNPTIKTTNAIVSNLCEDGGEEIFWGRIIQLTGEVDLLSLDLRGDEHGNLVKFVL